MTDAAEEQVARLPQARPPEHADGAVAPHRIGDRFGAALDELDLRESAHSGGQPAGLRFAVVVEQTDQVALGLRYAGVAGDARTFARRQHDADAVIVDSQALRGGAVLVGLGITHGDDHFEVDAVWDLLAEHGTHRTVQKRRSVVRRHDYGDGMLGVNVRFDRFNHAVRHRLIVLAALNA